MSPKHNQVVESEVNKMLEADVIVPNPSAWPFSIMIAAKKIGKPRFFVYYQSLKQRTMAGCLPITKIEEKFDISVGHRVLTTLDLFPDNCLWRWIRSVTSTRSLLNVQSPTSFRWCRLDFWRSIYVSSKDGFGVDKTWAFRKHIWTT